LLSKHFVEIQQPLARGSHAAVEQHASVYSATFASNQTYSAAARLQGMHQCQQHTGNKFIQRAGAASRHRQHSETGETIKMLSASTSCSHASRSMNFTAAVAAAAAAAAAAAVTLHCVMISHT
jgi:hypothetical protein